MAQDRELAKILGPLEAEVVEAVWAARKAVSVRDVLVAVNEGRRPPLAYTTVMTVMSRLAEKGVLRRTPEGRGYAYEALAKDAAEIAVRNVLREFGDSAVAHFLDEARADPKILRRLERILRDSR